MYAIIRIEKKQYRVEEKQKIFVEKLLLEEGETFECQEVLLFRSEKETHVGRPFLKDMKVTCKVLENIKSKKVIIFKKKRRKGYRKTQGHRQKYTMIEIIKIEN